MPGAENPEFVLGLDLDGVVADFYGGMRRIAAEWFGANEGDLPQHVTYGLPEWGFADVPEYKKAHRFAVTQRDFFREMPIIPGAPQAIRALSDAGIRIRIITYRLFIDHFHQAAVDQTVGWLEYHAIPYRDLCFMRSKGEVGADLYVEDFEENIQKLLDMGKDVIAFTNTTNEDMAMAEGHRANDWTKLQELVLQRYEAWTDGGAGG